MHHSKGMRREGCRIVDSRHVQHDCYLGPRPAAAAKITDLLFLDTACRPILRKSGAIRAKAITAVRRNFSKVAQNLSPFSTHPDHHQNAGLFTTPGDHMTSVLQACEVDFVIRHLL